MTSKVVVAGLGPAGPGLVTAATLAAIERVPHRYLRTARHPAASAVPDATSFDAVYEQAGTLEEVYQRVVEAVVEGAQRHGEVLYLVPGSPAVCERTVVLLREQGQVAVDVLPAMSFLELAWSRLGDPVASGARVVDGRRFAVEAAGQHGPLLVVQCDTRLVLSEVKLAVAQPPAAVTVLQRLGLPDEAVFEVAWDELDRVTEPDHLTSLWVPPLAAPVAGELARLAELVRTLRQRCPWDREQTHQSLTRHLLEEAYEAVEAIEGLDGAEGFSDLEEELGDLLFQVCFHATLAAEEGHFTLADVARGVHDKLVRRHPHVFGEAEAHDASQVMANWERAKKEEKGRRSIMDGVPAALPSLLLAQKVQRRAAVEGFDWESVEGPPDTAFRQAAGKVTEELDELRSDPSEHELGDLLFAVVNMARHLGFDPEAALRGATARFRDRFTAVERLAAEHRGFASGPRTGPPQGPNLVPEGPAL